MLEENISKTEEAAKKAFPYEQWDDAASLEFKYGGKDFELPDGIDNIKVARSRLTGLKDDERTLAKEIRQGKVLADTGASVFILPKIRAPDGRYLAGPDALVNGILYEFKTVTGGIDKVERRFRESRDQGQNVFIRVMNPDITKHNIIRKMYSVVNDPKYTGGFKGDLIFSVGQGVNETLYYVKISDLKK